MPDTAIEEVGRSRLSQSGPRSRRARCRPCDFRSACTRCGPAAALPVLPRAGGRWRRSLRGLLVEAVAHRAAVLRKARHPVHLRSRARASIRCRPLPIRPPMRGHAPRCAMTISPHPGSCPEIWRPARSRASHGALDGARRRAISWRMPTLRGPGSAALAAAMGAALQSVGGLGETSLPAQAAPVSRDGAEARQGDPAAGRALQGRARHQCPGRIPGRRRRQGRDCAAGASCWSTTF